MNERRVIHSAFNPALRTAPGIAVVLEAVAEEDFEQAED